MQSDPIPVDDLNDLDTRREARLLYEGLDFVVNSGVERDDHAVLIATAIAFIAACEMAEIDELDALCQIADRFSDGEIDLQDDPAQGRFVFAAGRA